MAGVSNSSYQNIEERRIKIYKAMSGEQKLRVSLDLYYFAQTIVKASIIEANPDISEIEMNLELKKRFSR